MTAFATFQPRLAERVHFDVTTGGVKAWFQRLLSYGLFHDETWHLKQNRLHAVRRPDREAAMQPG